MTAPDRIWAIFEPRPTKNDPPWVYASAEKTRGTKYIRSDLARAPLAEALAVPEFRGTREQLINAMEEMCRRETRNQERAIIRAALFELRAIANGDAE